MENLPKLDLSHDMIDMIRFFTEDDLSEFFYYREVNEWKYTLK